MFMMTGFHLLGTYKVDPLFGFGAYIGELSAYHKPQRSLRAFSQVGVGPTQ